MIIVFYSNFLNHHQLQLCKELQRLTNNNFYFIATQPTPKDRLELGYRDMNKEYPFVLTTYDSEDNRKKAFQLSIISDVVIHGSAPEEYIQKRIELNKLTFRYLERLRKNSLIHRLSPRYLSLIYKKHFRYSHKQLYVLCASAYTAQDLALYGCYRNKCIKWGYFPEVIEYDIDKLLSEKESNLILWVGRLIDWKHPEVAIKIAIELVKDGIPFKMRIIGSGCMERELRDLIINNNLSSSVELIGSLSPEEVRKNMEKASVFLFTSDKQEGWGAVLNEAMNSGCAIVANHDIGSVPFLLKDGINGYVYKHGNVKECLNQVEVLMKDSRQRYNLGSSAYNTLVTEWNAKRAAEKFFSLCHNIKNDSIPFFNEGVCSKASARI